MEMEHETFINDKEENKNCDGTINLKDESECDGKLNGFIYLHGFDPDLKDKVPSFVQANIVKTCKLSIVQPVLASSLRMRRITSLSDDSKNRQSFQQLPSTED